MLPLLLQLALIGVRRDRVAQTQRSGINDVIDLRPDQTSTNPLAFFKIFISCCLKQTIYLTVVYDRMASLSSTHERC